MNSLLIDIGASYTKIAEFDGKKLKNIKRIESDPYKTGTINKEDLDKIFISDNIYYTCQAGGEIKDGVFYNWMQSNKVGNECLSKWIKELYPEAIYCGIDRYIAFLGSGARAEELVVNIGTSGQIMIYSNGDDRIMTWPMLPGGWYLDKFDINKNEVYKNSFFQIYNYFPLIDEYIEKIYLTGSIAKKYKKEFVFYNTGSTRKIISKDQEDTLIGLSICAKEGYDGKQDIQRFICSRISK